MSKTQKRQLFQQQPPTWASKFGIQGAEDKHFPLPQVSATGGNPQTVSNPEDWLLCIQRQNQNSNQKSRNERALCSQMLPKPVYSDCISPRFPMPFGRRQRKSLFSWSHPSCSFLAHQQTFICSFDCCHFTDGWGLHLSCISCAFNSQLPLEKSRSQWATWHQVDNHNAQAVALPGQAASAKSLAS